MPPLHLLIKPSSGNCNLNCSYCFYRDLMGKRAEPSRGFMPGEVREALIRKALDYAEGQCVFGFQGGEPTLAGLGFYEEFVKLVKQYNRKNLDIRYYIQTNGFQMTEEWTRFLAEHHFLTGISLDGAIHTHNRYRKSRDGTGSFAQVMETIAGFKRCGVEYNILTVVNRATAVSAKKLYQFYRKNDFCYLQFIPCLDPIGEKPGEEEYSLTPEAYGKFLCDLFDLWQDDCLHGKRVSIRGFDNYLEMLRGYPPEACDMRGCCSVQHVIEADGGVYPCDFYVLDRWRLGSVLEEGFEDFRHKAAAMDFIRSSQNQEEACAACRYFWLCRGGCKRAREMSDNGRNYFCASYRMFFDYALDRMMRMREGI